MNIQIELTQGDITKLIIDKLQDVCDVEINESLITILTKENSNDSTWKKPSDIKVIFGYNQFNA